MALSAVEVDALKKAPAVEGVLPAVLERWSARSFAERAVSDADLKLLFEAVRWTASAYNEQPWRFVVGRRNTPEFKKLLESLIGFNQGWADKASVLILGASSTKFTHNGTENTYALYDLGAAAATLTLQAAELGLTSHTMAGFDHDAARKAFGIPEEFALGAIIALGYQGEPAALGQEQLITMETTPRERKALGEFVFSEWGQADRLG